jgi:hypothetical protein
VQALTVDLNAAANRTREFLSTQAARVTVANVSTTGRGLAFDVNVRNLTGHKLPTAYPSRRAWLHVTVRDGSGQVLFESGALNADGSIRGNSNDEDPLKFEPHRSAIRDPQQVEIFESILKDSNGHVTTGLISAVGYLKDNRVLPAAFDKATADADIAVVGKAADDPGFEGGVSRTRYEVSGGAAGPYRISVELMYQPVGFRWAHNLAPYQAEEPQRFVGYYEAAAERSATVLATADAIISASH